MSMSVRLADALVGREAESFYYFDTTAPSEFDLPLSSTEVSSFFDEDNQLWRMVAVEACDVAVQVARWREFDGAMIDLLAVESCEPWVGDESMMDVTYVSVRIS